MRLLPALILALLVLAAPARAAVPLELGLQDDPVFLERAYADAGIALDRAAELGTDRIRVNLLWSQAMPAAQAAAQAEPDSVAWDFSRLETLYADAAARGIELQVTLTGPAPAWATGDGAIGYDRPDSRAFGEFAAAATAAFVGRIDRWSIWNEPNWNRFLTPKRSAPALYRSLYRRAYAAIKAADPRASVLIGELMPGVNPARSTQALKFLRAVTCARTDYRRARRCAPLVADGFAIHPYNFSKRPRDARHPSRDTVEIGSLSRLTKALDRLRAAKLLRTPSNRRMPVYLTEFGYFTEGPVARSAAQHAAWMKEAWRIAERNPRVRQLLQYLLIDPWRDHVTWRTALMTRDGTPRPVYNTLRSLAN